MFKKRGASLALAMTALVAIIAAGEPAKAQTVGRPMSNSGPTIDVYPTCNYSRTTAALSGGQVIVPSVQSTGSITCVLGYGNSGRAVKRLQMSLNACYYALYFVIDAPLVEDGVYGSLTREAVMDVQRHVGLGADGVYGPQTRDAMLHEGATLLPPCNWVA